jgi:hypothetical protein
MRATYLDDEAVKFSAGPIVQILVCHETQPKQNLRELTAQDHSHNQNIQHLLNSERRKKLNSFSKCSLIIRK